MQLLEFYIFFCNRLQKITIQHASLGIRNAYSSRVMPSPLGDRRNGFALSLFLKRGQEISKLLLFAKLSEDSMSLLYTLIKNRITARNLINYYKCKTYNCFKQEWQSLCQRCNVYGNDCRAVCGRLSWQEAILE